MKIGLIGAPGSRKTTLARAFAPMHRLSIIDGYVDELERRSDYVFGKHASYAGNIGIGLERHVRERRAEDDFITCGTMIETVAYMALSTPVAPDEIDHRRLTGGLVVLGAMVEDLMRYDHMFYIPGQPADEIDAQLGEAIEETLKIFGPKYTILDQELIADRVTAIEAVLS